MTYTKHHAHALILQHQDHGESDRMFMLLTETHGVLRAVAQSVREEKSKLRNALTYGPCVSVELIQTRGNWRITNARAEGLTAMQLPVSVQRARERVLSLTERLIDTEEPVPEIFHILNEGIRCLENASLRPDDITTIETIVVMRILHRLGYFGGGKYFEHIIASPYITDTVVAEASRLRSKIIPHINRSMREIQL